MDVSNMRNPEDWPFHIPDITADAIRELKEAYRTDSHFIGDELDDFDRSTREMSNPDQETQVRNYYLLEQWR